MVTNGEQVMTHCSWRKRTISPNWRISRCLMSSLPAVIVAGRANSQVADVAAEDDIEGRGKKQHKFWFYNFFCKGCGPRFSQSYWLFKQVPTRHRPMTHPVVFRYISYSTTLAEHVVHRLRRCPAFARVGTSLFLSINLKWWLTSVWVATWANRAKKLP